jgi:hypothetical protein
MDQKALQNFIMKEANAASLKCTKKKIWEKYRTAKIKGQI